MENKTNLGCRTAIAASVFVASIAGAQNSKWFNLTANDDNPAPVNRFGLSYRAGFNVSAKFRNVAGLSQVNDPGPVASQANHNYDDGRTAWTARATITVARWEPGIGDTRTPAR